MGSTFDVKMVVCDYEKTNAMISSLENEWLSSLLTRAMVPKVMLSQRLKDVDFDNARWRDYLLKTFSISIAKNIKNGLLSVSKYNGRDDKNVLIAEWSRPDVVRVDNDSGRHYEIRLKYWNLI